MDEILQTIEAILTCDDTMFSAVEKELEKTVSDSLFSGQGKQARETQIKEFKDAGLSRAQVEDQMEEMKSHFLELFANMKDHTKNPDKHQFIDQLYRNIEIFAQTIVDEYDADRPTVSVELCREGAQLPTYAHTGDHADIYAVEDTTIEPNTFGNMVPTGLKMEIPQGWAISVRPRSGLSKKTCLRISNTPGSIDTGYRGEINILFDNIGFEPITIHKGDRIAQLVLEKQYQAIFIPVEKVSEDTDRGAGGFGSSGK